MKKLVAPALLLLLLSMTGTVRAAHEEDTSDVATEESAPSGDQMETPAPDESPAAEAPAVEEPAN